MNDATNINFPPHRVTDDPNDSNALPAPYYTSDEIFRTELEQIFYKSWIYAGHVSKLQGRGDYITTSINDQEIFIIRAADGKLNAFYNVCKHRAHTLLKGEGRAMVVTCPAHNWAYGLDGKLRSGPGLEKLQNFNNSEVCLTSVLVEEFAGFIFINLDSSATPLVEQVAGLKEKILSYVPHPEKLVLAYRKTRPSTANWKSVVDNYLECYHCKSTHKSFCEVVDMDGYSTTPYGNWSWHSGPGFPETDADNNVQVNEGFAGAHLWPNLTVNFFPGRNDEIMLFYSIPVNADNCIDVMEFYMSSSSLSDESKAEIEWVCNVLTEEDINLIENVHRGMKSRGYYDGRLVVNTERNYLSEHSLHHFHNKVLKAIGAK